MEGYILNHSGKTKHIFKRKFPVGHKIELDSIWGLYKSKVCAFLDKEEVEITTEDFVSWLDNVGKIPEGFEIVYSEEGDSKDIIESSSSDTSDDLGNQTDGRLKKPTLAGAKQGVVDTLTYKDLANLHISDDPKDIISRVSNLSKLRRAYTVVRTMPRKRSLEIIMRNRIQELERLS